MFATVSDSRDEEFPPPQQLDLQKDARDFTENLEKFVTFSSRIFVRRELNTCPKLPPGLLGG